MALASSAVVATPWVASAAENRPPSQPALSELTTGGKACVGGGDRPYVGTRPTLEAVLRDPDGGRVSAEFEVSWTDASGAGQVRSTVQTTAKSSSPERDGGQPPTLGGDATIYRDDVPCDWLDPDCLPSQSPIFGAGHLLLDGDGDFAATDGQGIAAGESFSVAAHVRIDGAAQDRPMTVLSVRSADNSLAEVRYSGASQQWEVALTDVNGEPLTLTAQGAWASPDDVHHLALVYDDEADEILLHADGQLSARTSYRPGWTATGDLQIGRSQGAEGWGGYLRGAVDEVHAYAGALTATQVTRLAVGATDV